MLHSKRFMFDAVHTLLRDVRPAPTKVAYFTDMTTCDSVEWLVADWHEFQRLGNEHVFSWLTIHAFDGDLVLSEIIEEDAQLATSGDYRQNPAAAWEFYVIDSCWAVLILPDRFQLCVRPPWEVLVAGSPYDVDLFRRRYLELRGPFDL